MNGYDYFTGFMDSLWQRRCSVNKCLIARTAIDPVRATASQRKLYSQRVIEEGQKFITTVEYHPDLQGTLRLLLGQPFTARIGTGTSRGQGWVKVEKFSTTPPGWTGSKERFKQFPAYKDKSVLAVTLLSDGIFSDDYLRDSSILIPAHLEPLGIKPDNWDDKPVKAYAATRLIFGFDGYPVQLPRIPRLAVCAGSTFLFTARTDNPVIPVNNGTGWIGDNQLEGFGQAILWHPFHLKFREDQAAEVKGI